MDIELNDLVDPQFTIHVLYDGYSTTWTMSKNETVENRLPVSFKIPAGQCAEIAEYCRLPHQTGRRHLKLPGTGCKASAGKDILVEFIIGNPINVEVGECVRVKVREGATPWPISHIALNVEMRDRFIGFMSEVAADSVIPAYEEPSFGL